MRHPILLCAGLLACACLAASPSAASTAERSAAADGASHETADDLAEDDSGVGEEDEEGIPEEIADDDSDRNEARIETRTRIERKRYLHASTQRTAVRRAASAHHRRVYRYHRYLRSAGPFYRKNLRRRLPPAENVEE